MRGEFFVLEYIGWDSTYTEIVGGDRVRPKNTNPPLENGAFHRFEIEVPEDVRDQYVVFSFFNTYNYSGNLICSAKVEGAHREFKKFIGAGLVRYQPDKGTLLIISRSEATRSMAMMLQDMHFRSLSQKVLLLKRTEEAARQLENTKLATVGG